MDRLKQIEEALGFYADERNHEHGRCYGGDGNEVILPPVIEGDHGDLSGAALRLVREMKTAQTWTTTDPVPDGIYWVRCGNPCSFCPVLAEWIDGDWAVLTGDDELTIAEWCGPIPWPEPDGVREQPDGE